MCGNQNSLLLFWGLLNRNATQTGNGLGNCNSHAKEEVRLPYLQTSLLLIAQKEEEGYNSKLRQASTSGTQPDKAPSMT
ncbi:hypothetical protein Tco_0307862 [Tanacetum coccineum]